MDEVFNELKSYPDWNETNLYKLRVKKAGKEIVEAKYGIKFEDYVIILKAAFTGQKDCDIVIFAFIMIRGKEKEKWFDERAITCLDSLKLNKKEKIQV